MVRRRWGTDAQDMLESGTLPVSVHDAQLASRPKPRVPGDPLRLIWSGVHIGRKALPILLHALSQFQQDSSGVHLNVLGDGPETRQWQHLARELGVAERVTWSGRLPRQEALRQVQRADALVFTSVQEGTPHAVLEALSLGVPVVCHDACGMGVAVIGECGIKIPLKDPGTSIAGFASAVRRLRDSDDLLTQLSAGALAAQWSSPGLPRVGRSHRSMSRFFPLSRRCDHERLQDGQRIGHTGHLDPQHAGLGSLLPPAGHVGLRNRQFPTMRRTRRDHGAGHLDDRNCSRRMGIVAGQASLPA